MIWLDETRISFTVEGHEGWRSQAHECRLIPSTYTMLLGNGCLLQAGFFGS